MPAATTGKGSRNLKAALGEAADAVGRTNTRLGACKRWLVWCMGKRKGAVAIARTLLIMIWELLADPSARYADLGVEFYTDRIQSETPQA